MVVVPLESKKRERALMLQKYQHLLPAIPLMSAGLGALSAGAHGLELALALFEIVTSALLIGTVVVEIRARRAADVHDTHRTHSVDWFHLFAAAVLLAEATERWHLTHHWARPTLLTAVVSLGLGLFHGRIDAGIRRRRMLRLDDEGIYLSTRPFSHFRARWADVTAIDLDRRFATVRTRQGQTRQLDLADLYNGDRVRAALDEARGRLVSAERTAE